METKKKRQIKSFKDLNWKTQVAIKYYGLIFIFVINMILGYLLFSRLIPIWRFLI